MGLRAEQWEVEGFEFVTADNLSVFVLFCVFGDGAHFELKLEDHLLRRCKGAVRIGK